VEKARVLFFLNRFRDERKPVDHVAEAQRGTSYAARARKVEASEAEPSAEQQALEVAIAAVSQLDEQNGVFG